jgi:glycosyltransferase involved in cell wall biosynthesis
MSIEADMNLRRKPKVLVAAPLPPPYSGIEAITQRLLGSDLNKTFRLIHVNTSHGNKARDRGRWTFHNVCMSLLNVTRLFFVILIHRPDVVITILAQNTGGFLRDSLLICISKFMFRQVAVHFGGEFFDVFYNRSSRFMKQYICFVLARIDCIQIWSHRFKQQFRDLISQNKICCFYSGLEAECFETKPRYNSPPQIVQILFLSAISYAKGAIDVLKAVPLVISKCQNVRFLFAGEILAKEYNIAGIDNPEDNEKEIALLVKKYNIDPYVQFIGPVFGKKKMEVFRDSHIFVLPSYSEGGGPFAVLEAMAAGMPVVATPVGVLPEVCKEGENIFFVEKGKPCMIADRLLKLIEDLDLRYRMGEANRLLATEKFHITNFADHWAQILHQLIDK